MSVNHLSNVHYVSPHKVTKIASQVRDALNSLAYVWRTLHYITYPYWDIILHLLFFLNERP